MIVFLCSTGAIAQNTIPSSRDTISTGKEVRQLRRDRVAMLLIIEQLEGELALLKMQIDSCDTLINEYQLQINKCKGIYSNYDKLIEQKNVVLALDARQIKLLKHEAKLLRTKLIATGVVLPTATAGVAAVVTFLFMSLKK